MAPVNQSRQLGVTLRQDGSVIRVAGYIDEVADFSPLLAERPPLKLALEGVVAMNSLGIRRWIRFIHAYGVKAIEFHNCPPVFLDTANMIPDVVSATGNMKRVKSALVPHGCRACSTSFLPLVATGDMAIDDGKVLLPVLHCPTCNRLAECEVDPDDYFLFLTGPDKA